MTQAADYISKKGDIGVDMILTNPTMTNRVNELIEWPFLEHQTKRSSQEAIFL